MGYLTHTIFYNFRGSRITNILAKADLQIHLGNFRFVPEADTRSMEVGGNLRPETDARGRL